MAYADEPSLGNMGQLFDYDNWDYMRRLLDAYGSVCRLHFFIGVGAIAALPKPECLHFLVTARQLPPGQRPESDTRDLRQRPG